MLKKICLLILCLLVSGGSVWAKGFGSAEEALQVYNDALRNGDAAAAYAVLSPEDREVMTLEEFTARYMPQSTVGDFYRLQAEPEVEETLAFVDEAPTIQDYTESKRSAAMPFVDVRKDAELQAVTEAPVVVAMEKAFASATPSPISQPQGSMAGGAGSVRDLAPKSRAEADAVRVVNIITLRQEGDGWYVFHNRAAEAKLEELLNQALDLARHDIMDNLLTARDMFAQAFAVEGFDALKDSYRQSYRYVLERISFLTAEEAYHEYLSLSVAEVVPEAGAGLKYKIALYNQGDRQLRMLSFEVTLVDGADAELCRESRTITFKPEDTLPGSVWQSDYFELAGFTENPGDDAKVLVALNRVYLKN